MSWDSITHMAEIVTILSVGVPGIVFTAKIARKIDRFLFTVEEYPLHRHENGKIVYPQGSKLPIIKRFSKETTT